MHFSYSPEFTSQKIPVIFNQRKKQMRLLIAEDSEKIRTMIKDIVRIYFSEIYECDNGEDACELYKQNKPDWTFMDIEMPGMDGISATRKITEENPDAKVIIVTNYDNEAFRRNAKEAGAIKYILKENTNEILELLKQFSIN
jgi:two-component system, chemotaxis family, chemotaxis protein CheY